MKNSILNLLQEPHSNKDKFLPLNLLLFNTGYFTIKRVSDDQKAELDWTNNESSKNFQENSTDHVLEI